MSDLPSTLALQQSKARSVSGTELAAYAKCAADAFYAGRATRAGRPSLTQAVVDTIKSAGLSPEQARRVVEMTNVRAFREEHSKEGSVHKYVHFDDGPANPVEVIQDLNSGGGGTVLDYGIGDYAAPPSSETTTAASGMDSIKTAEAVGLPEVADPVDAWLTKSAAVADNELPYADPLGSSYRAQQKVAHELQFATADLSRAEMNLERSAADMVEAVKQACLNGTHLGEIVQAWQTLGATEEVVKYAFARITPGLVRRNGVFPTVEDFSDDLMKTASKKALNLSHPVMHAYAAMMDALQKHAAACETQAELQGAYEKIDAFNKRASLVGQSWKHLTQAADAASRPMGMLTGGISDAVGGTQVGKTVQRATEMGVRYSPHLAVAGAGVAGGLQAAKLTPEGQYFRYRVGLSPT